jgi:signal transduction histidine kinase
VLAEVIADMDPGNERVRLAPGSEAWVDVPVPAFRRMIENLIGNAIDYADGCTIEVLHSNGQVTVSVIDNGPGIAPADRERLLRPFERGDASRNRATGGAGLGLSIVRDFAARHRGHFALRGNAEGGTTAALRLPAYCIDAEAVLDGGSEPCPVARSRRLPD